MKLPIPPRFPSGLAGGRALIAALAIALQASPAMAQASPDAASDNSRLETSAKFLGGAALGLVLHEGGHLTFDLLVGATPGVKGVSYAGIPFFAITHEPVTAPKEFAISSAGFWVQHLSSELLLSRRPNLRRERAPVAKGMLAFNVLVSVMYAGAALAQTGPPERDTRGVALSAHMAEPWVAPVILVPAALDTVRYFNPDSRAAKWASRAAKVGGVLLIFRTRS